MLRCLSCCIAYGRRSLALPDLTIRYCQSKHHRWWYYKLVLMVASFVNYTATHTQMRRPHSVWNIIYRPTEKIEGNILQSGVQTIICTTTRIQMRCVCFWTWWNSRLFDIHFTNRRYFSRAEMMILETHFERDDSHKKWPERFCYVFCWGNWAKFKVVVSVML